MAKEEAIQAMRVDVNYLIIKNKISNRHGD